MPRLTLRGAGVYEIVIGALVLVATADAARLRTYSGTLVPLALCGVLCIASGILLALWPRRWARLAAVLQLAQTIHIQTPWIQYAWVMGYQAGAALVIRRGAMSSAGVTLFAYPMTAFEFHVGLPTDVFLVALNIIPLLVLFAIWQADASVGRSEGKARSESSRDLSDGE